MKNTPLTKLRAELARRKLDGFLIPHDDEHDLEFTPPYADRLAFVTGFTGSAGLALLLKKKALLFVDGRYTLQAQQEAPGWKILNFTQDTVLEQIRKLHPHSHIGYDPWLHTLSATEKLRKAAREAHSTLTPCATNPVDAIWQDQPLPPHSAVVIHPLAYAGERARSKRLRLARTLKADAFILTNPASIDWLLNIRASDVPHAPLLVCFAALHKNAHVTLFIDPKRLNKKVRAHLGKDVKIHKNFVSFLKKQKGVQVALDPTHTAAAIATILKRAGAQISHSEDPCLLPRACKNKTELEGARAAHLRDGLALTRFLCWLSHNTPSKTLNEHAAAQKLEAFRRQNSQFEDLSFDTISGAGPNGAIIHYRPTPQTNRKLTGHTLYLVDSGGQYLDGTTDVTRTVALGTPTAEHRDRFTRVLKGHIAIASTRFPEGTTGGQLDALARLALWEAGLDFSHGTGHGVGSYLCVHEGPANISKASQIPLSPHMILSNEPGYYKAGAYGIRIENLMVVREPQNILRGEIPMLSFETLTLAPIDLSLIEPHLLTPPERLWLNTYHQNVYRTLSPLLDSPTAAWLKKATSPL